MLSNLLRGSSTCIKKCRFKNSFAKHSCIAHTSSVMSFIAKGLSVTGFAFLICFSYNCIGVNVHLLKTYTCAQICNNTHLVKLSSFYRVVSPFHLRLRFGFYSSYSGLLCNSCLLCCLNTSLFSCKTTCTINTIGSSNNLLLYQHRQSFHLYYSTVQCMELHASTG